MILLSVIILTITEYLIRPTSSNESEQKQEIDETESDLTGYMKVSEFVFFTVFAMSRPVHA